MGQKRIFNMVDDWIPVFYYNGNDVETGIQIKIIAVNIGVGCRNQQTLFLLIYCKVRISVVVTFTGFHFHNYQLIAVLGNNVNLLMPIAPITFKDFIPLVHQILNCDFLSLFPKINMCCHNQ